VFVASEPRTSDEDTFDKLDIQVLGIDTRRRVAQLYDLATRVLLQ
jgi:hypothetical protein